MSIQEQDGQETEYEGEKKGIFKRLPGWIQVVLIILCAELFIVVISVAFTAVFHFLGITPPRGSFIGDHYMLFGGSSIYEIVCGFLGW